MKQANVDGMDSSSSPHYSTNDMYVLNTFSSGMSCIVMGIQYSVWSLQCVRWVCLDKLKPMAGSSDISPHTPNITQQYSVFIVSTYETVHIINIIQFHMPTQINLKWSI